MGVPLAAIAARAGHASKAFTANTYVHDLPSGRDEAAQVVSGLLKETATQLQPNPQGSEGDSEGRIP